MANSIITAQFSREFIYIQLTSSNWAYSFTSIWTTRKSLMFLSWKRVKIPACDLVCLSRASTSTSIAVATHDIQACFWCKLGVTLPKPLPIDTNIVEEEQHVCIRVHSVCHGGILCHICIVLTHYAQFISRCKVMLFPWNSQIFSSLYVQTEGRCHWSVRMPYQCLRPS